MSDITVIQGGKVVFPDKVQKKDIIIKNGIIECTDQIGELPAGAEIIDAHNHYVAPGFVEIHIHGGGGCDFMDCTDKAFEKISEIHRKHGITSMLPTAVSCGVDELTNLFDVYRRVINKETKTRFLGIHLEGPFISDKMRGAQNPKHIRKPSEYETDKLIECGGDIIKMCTAAPELNGIEYMAKTMQKHNITLSIGHSNGIFGDVEKAMQMGFRHITHLYSNTPGIRKINQTVYAGIPEAAYYFDEMHIELIGDGHHVPAEVLRLALKIKGANKINITSDAMRAAGTNVKESYLGKVKPENRVIIEDGVAKLPDRSYFAGSIATGDVMLKWLVNKCKISICDAVKMLSLSPASIIGEDKKIGSIEKGKLADILLIDENLDVKKVIIGQKNVS